MNCIQDYIADSTTCFCNSESGLQCRT